MIVYFCFRRSLGLLYVMLQSLVRASIAHKGLSESLMLGAKMWAGIAECKLTSLCQGWRSVCPRGFVK